ncbi:hypothetical protein AB0N14_16680 [Streptomyces sp. NPDC051104]|uniref:hypothetical protein n=1 Tax=Streptomyces sp. NPDC051104 TaxID=3155044 RepID=UPI00341B9578
MNAKNLLETVARTAARGRWLCLPAATVLALVAGPCTAVAAEHRADVPVCPITQPAPSTTVQVPATAGPTGIPGATRVIDTGVCVRSAVRITATGSIAIDGSTTTFTPWGDSTRLAGSDFPLAGVPSWSLIARIGNGPWHYIGSGPTTLVGSGELYLAVNDNFNSDNRGSFAATITPCVCGFRFGPVAIGAADGHPPVIGTPCSD